MTTRTDVLRTMLPRARDWSTNDVLKVLRYCSTVPETDIILACCNAILRKDVNFDDDDIEKAFNSIISILRRKKGESVEEACAHLLEFVVKSMRWEISFPLLDAAKAELASFPAVNTLFEFEIIANHDFFPKLVSDCSSPRSNFIAACWGKVLTHINTFETESLVASVVEAFLRPAGLSTAAQIEGTKLLAMAALENDVLVRSALLSTSPLLPTFDELNLLQEMKTHAMDAWEMCELSPHEGFIGACWEGYQMAPKPTLQMIDMIAKTVNRSGSSTYLEHLGSKIAGLIANDIIRRDKNDKEIFIKITHSLNRMIAEASGARFRGVIHQLLFTWIRYAQNFCYKDEDFCEQLNTYPEMQIFLTEALTSEAIAEVDGIAQQALDLIEHLCDDDVNCLALRLRGIDKGENWTREEEATFLDMRELLISKQLEEAASAKHVKAIFEYKTPLYYMGGHGRSLPGTFVVPPGCTLVTTTLFGVSSLTKVGCRMRELFSDVSNRDMLLRIELPASREAIRRWLQLPEGHNVHVYTAGTLAPNISYSPGNYANVGGLLKFPIQAVNDELYNNADPCVRFSAGGKNEDSPLETDVVMAKFGQSLYPTSLQILTAFPKLSKRTTAAISENFRIPVSEIMKRFRRGVYYFTSCRGGDLTEAAKELVPKTVIWVSPSAAFDFVTSHRADLDRETLSKLTRLRDKDVSSGLEEAARFSRLPGAHRQTRSSDVVLAPNVPLKGIASNDGFL